MKPVRAGWSIFKTLKLDNYQMEPKLDGHRAMVVMDNGIQIWTRDKNRIVIPDNLSKQLSVLKIPDGTVLDGEIWNMSKRGAWRHDKSSVCALTLWDAIKVDHKDISNEPLETRRIELEKIIGGKNTPEIKLTEIASADESLAHDFDEQARSFRNNTHSRSGFIHGIVLKRRGSPRRDNAIRCVEHADWIKLVFSGMQSGL